MAVRFKRVVIFLLCLLNVVMIFMTYRAVDKHKLKTYSIDLLHDKFNKLILNQPVAAKVEKQPHNAFIWGKIDNLHKALPAYEKMRQVLSNLHDYGGQFNRQASYLGLSHEMLRYKSIMNLGNIDLLKDIFADALQTNRSIKLGIVGGTYSSTKLLCKAKSCLYIDLISQWIEKVLEVKVIIHNSALSCATSDYFSWCLSPHLDVLDMDIIIWELATEDYTMRDVFSQNVFDNPARPQEELTRRVLMLPNKPLLLFFNFLSAKNIRTRDCVNSEYFAGRHLAMYYNVTSVSWSAAVCSRLWRYGFTPDDLVRSDNQLTPLAHHQGALFIINLFRNVLEEVTINQMNRTKTDETHIKKIISLHDVFQENTKSHDMSHDIKPNPGQNQTTPVNITNGNHSGKTLPNARFHGDILRNLPAGPHLNLNFSTVKL
ncbi:uncharacterized protein [Amphiura filiformis]|uniref:uncharacterized protein n=1 Tax=Amphiura filiformis TaxID=82378 RepID=UPI003B219964